MALTEYIDETIDDLDLKSFNTHSTLCPKLWDDMELNDSVRRKLLDSSQQFYDFLKIDQGVLSDIVLVGSMANYNWSQYSDIDIHLVIDFNNVDATPELLRTYFDARKDNWKSKHEIIIHGFDIEFYVENIDDHTTSDGRYSLVTKSWIQQPSKLNMKVNKVKVQLKAESFITAVKEVKALKQLGNPERAYEYADKLYDKLYKYRRTGLEKGGEFSIENIVFKALRHNGTVDELRSLKNELFDEMYSLRESK